METFNVSIPVRLDIEIDANDLDSALAAINTTFNPDQWRDELQGHKINVTIYGARGVARIMGAVAQGEATEL